MPIARAIVFAAGFGTRMRPLTDHTPKALLEVGGRPLIDHTLARFAEAGIGQLVVNTHYLGEKVGRHVRARFPDLEITVSAEDPILETGGGIVNVIDFFEDMPFFSANSDMIWLDDGTPALARLARAFDPARMDALLLVQPRGLAVGYRGPGDFDLASDGHLIRGRAAPYVFTGLQILTPRLFAGRSVAPFSLRELYARAEGEGGRLSRMVGLVHTGAWLHVGSPEELALANAFFEARGER